MGSMPGCKVQPYARLACDSMILPRPRFFCVFFYHHYTKSKNANTLITIALINLISYIIKFSSSINS